MSAGGALGTGGTFSTSGKGGASGAPSTGGAVGTGGVLGGTCSATSECPSAARCCSGADQGCDGTRLPAGDGTNAGEFVASADGLSVTDTITGLVWQRDGSGTREGCAKGTTCTWAEAKTYCAGLALGGLSGWRLPTVIELSTILAFTVTSGARIDETGFPSAPAEWFWTSSPFTGLPDYAWGVDFGYGYSTAFSVGSDYRVRCVR
jgi:hypothetical protein